MKLMVSLGCGLTAAACLAGVGDSISVESSNTYGVMRINSTSKKTIVAIPWCACSAEDNQDIAVSNVIYTANLVAGDTIHVLNESNAFNTWRLDEGADGVLYWRSICQVNGDGTATETPTPDGAGIKRGEALVLIRQGVDPNGVRDLTKPFYVVGQVGAGEVVREITPGTSDAPAYNLVSTPGGEPLDIIGALEYAAVGDQIQYVYTNGNFVVHTYYGEGEGKGWCHPSGRKTVHDDKLLSITGMGFWYISKSNSGQAPKFTWGEALAEKADE